MTQLSIAGTFTSCTPHERKCKQWMEITDAVTVETRGCEQMEENIFSIFLCDSIVTD